MGVYTLDSVRPVEPARIRDRPGRDRLWQVMRRRWVTGLAIVAGCIVAGAIYSAVAPRRYTAHALVQVSRRGEALASLSGLDAGAASDAAVGTDAATGGDSDGVPDETGGSGLERETQARLLRSETTARRVVERLGLERSELERTAEFETRSGLFGAGRSSSSAEAVRRFERNLNVAAVPGTSLIEVSYTSRDPRLAAAVASEVVADPGDTATKSGTQAGSQSASRPDRLDGQVQELRRRSEADQRRLTAAEGSAGIFSLGADAAGREQVYAEGMERLRRSANALAAATEARTARESILKAARSGDLGSLPESSPDFAWSSNAAGKSSADAAVAGRKSAGLDTQIRPALGRLASLRMQQVALRSQLAGGTLSGISADRSIGRSAGRDSEIRATLERVDQAVNDEIARVAVRAEIDYRAALRAEQAAKADNVAARRAATVLTEKAGELALLRGEAAESRSVYEALRRRAAELNILRQARPRALTVVDPPRVPERPSSPEVPRDLGTAIGLGLVCGLAGMLAREALDGRVQSVEQIERMGLPVLGVLPQCGESHETEGLDGLRGLRSLSAPRSAYAEAVRGVRASLVPAAARGPHRVIVVTSAVTGEGKSLTARNLAVSVAQQGKRVVLVDAELYGAGEKDGGEGEFGAKEGLATVLSGAQTMPSLMQVADLSSLYLLPAGMAPSDAAELLGSPRMKTLVDELRAQFEVVLIDAPPVLQGADGAVLAGLADSVLLVARQGRTEQEALARAREMLAIHARPQSVAVVLNGLGTDADIYRGYVGRTAARSGREQMRAA